jgi:hypothetical protein
MSHWMFNCKDVSKKVSKSMDHTLPLHERMMIALHLMMCKYCRRFKDQLLLLRKAVRFENLPGHDVDESVSLPLEIRERIKQTMRSTFSDSVR